MPTELGMKPRMVSCTTVGWGDGSLGTKSGLNQPLYPEGWISFHPSSSIGPSPKLSPTHLALFSRKHDNSLWASCTSPFLPFQKCRFLLQPSTSLSPLFKPTQTSTFSTAFNLLQSIMLSVSSSASFDVTLLFLEAVFSSQAALTLISV